MNNKTSVHKKYIPNFKLSELLEKVEKDNDTFWLRNSYGKRYQPTKDLWILVEKSSCIFGHYWHGDKFRVSPDHIYFEVIDSCLYYKYQSILGGRLLAYITDLDKQENFTL